MGLVGLIPVIINARWVNEIENIRDYTWPSMFAIPLNVIAILFVPTLLNCVAGGNAARTRSKATNNADAVPLLASVVSRQ